MRKNKFEDSRRLYKLGNVEMLIPGQEDPIDLEAEQETIPGETITLMDVLLDAVSYRVEFPVTQMLYYHAMGSGYPLCLRCDTAIEREYMQYCDRCGQRLGWDCWEDAEVVDSSLRSGRKKVTFFTLRTWLDKGVMGDEQSGSWKKDSGGSSE